MLRIRASISLLRDTWTHIRVVSEPRFFLKLDFSCLRRAFSLPQLQGLY